MNLSFRQLRVFLEVAQRGGVTAAAQALHLTPPAVSMQIKELESQVGLQLFDRQGRTMTLSTAGEYFAVHAKRMLAALRDADHAMARFKRLEHGLLTVGMVSTAKYFVPRLLAEFRRDHPGIDVRLTEATNREALVRQMEAGEVDLSIMGRAPPELSARSEPFAAHPQVFFCPPEHPLTAIGHPPLKALARYPLIARETGSGTRASMNRFYADHGQTPEVAMEFTSNEAVRESVRAGLGIGFLSLHTLGLELRLGLLLRVDVEGTPVMRTWHIVHLQSKVLSPAAEAFRYFVLERGEPLLVEHDTPLLQPAG